MKTMKQITAIFLALILALSLAACSTPTENPPADSKENNESPELPATGPASAASSLEGKKVGIAIREIVNDFDRDIIAGAQELIEAGGGAVTVVDTGADVGKHNENIENLINSGVDGIVIILGDAQQMAPVVEKAEAAGIPVVTCAIMSHVPGSLTDVSADEILVSTLCSRMLLSAMDFSGDLHAFWVPGAPLLEQRKRALEAMLVDFPQVNLIEVPTEHNPAKVQSQMEDILTANPDAGSIAGVWVAYDQLGTGAYQAIMNAGRNEIKMASCDGDKISYQMLFAEDSPLVAIGCEDVKKIGTIGAEVLIRAIQGEDVSAVPQSMYTTAFGANRNNGIAAAEVRYGSEVWDELGLDSAEIAKAFPQTQDVYVVQPVLP